LQLERKPILCYVTDLRALEGTPALHAAIRRAAAAGTDWIQIREKDLEARALVGIVRRAAVETRGTSARLIINERLDVAVATGAAGVHLGETSLPVEDVIQWRRSTGRAGFQIGASCHSPESALAAEHNGADYVFFGPVFATPSKIEFGRPQGVERLREVCGTVRIPVLAIGGITTVNSGACLAAGAAGVAAIRLFQESDDVAAAVARLRGEMAK
jgi:thiamine-phosphate pyrophosphorylase